MSEKDQISNLEGNNSTTENNQNSNPEGNNSTSENNQNLDPKPYQENVKNLVSNLNDKMKEKMCQRCLKWYYILLSISVLVFLGLIIAVFYTNIPLPKQHGCGFCPASMPELVVFRWTMVLKMFVILLLSLVLVWWVKYLGKLISNCREAMKPWQNKVTDTYAFLLEMETMLYKVICENRKKAIEVKDDKNKEDKSSSKPEDIEKMVEKYVKEAIEAIMEEKKQELTEVGWVVRLKDDNNNPS